jgi:15-cis-phytoene synthase
VNSEDQHCFDVVRLNDRDRYLAGLFAPEKKRADLFALYAFNAEIARIRASVSEAHLGEIRLQWWLDTIDAIYHGDTQQHPVAIALARAIANADLPKHAFQALLKAHIFDFYSDTMPTIVDVEGYLGETSAALIQLASLILAGHDGLENAEVAGLAGVAYGMAELLCALPQHQRLLQCFIPADFLSRRDLTATTLYDSAHSVAASLVIAEMREKARERLLQARKMAWTIKEAAQPAFLHVALTQPYLEKIAKRGVAVLRLGGNISQIRKQWVLWQAAKTESF